MKLSRRVIINSVLISLFIIIAASTLPRALDQFNFSSQDLPDELGIQATVIGYKDILTISIIGLYVLCCTTWSWMKLNLLTRIIGLLVTLALVLSIHQVSIMDAESSYFYNGSQYTALYISVAIASVPFILGLGYPKLVQTAYRRLKKSPL
jgi:hypothetical protein